MLENRAPEPFDLTFSPTRYAAPDWEEVGTVTKLWVPDDETVGWLVWQDPDRLAFLSVANPEDLGYVVRELVRDLMVAGARTGRPARDVWNDVLTRTLHTTPTEESLPAFTAGLRNEWKG